MRLPENLYSQVLRSMPVVAVDGVLFSEGKVLLLKRKDDPFRGSWVLPGGMVKYGETLEEATTREFEEETKIIVRVRSLVNVYSQPHRDPRGHIIAVAYLCEPLAGNIANRLEENINLQLFELNKLPNNLGFDHRKIIEDALRVKKSLDI